MPDDLDDRLEELFHAALKHDPAERVAFLAEACRANPSLREKVERLLAAHEKTTDFLEKPAWAMFVHPDAKEGAEAARLAVGPGLPFGRLGAFRLIRRLGAGGMGVVYLAVQESLGRQVALKVLRLERAGSFEAETRFRREVGTISELSHPNIVTVYGSGEAKGIRYFAMELVPGKGLDDVLREASSRGEMIPTARILDWTRDIADALDYAHQAGIIHRDVKPSNIRITPEGRPVLLDFGVAHHTDLASLTLTGEFRGTPHYASPEQVNAKRREIDARTDLYSLGVTLYEAVTGRVPFEGETTEQVFHQILEKEPVPPYRLNSEIPRDLETVILKAMEKDPERRYQTMADFAGDLQRILNGEMILAKPASFATKIWKRIRRNPAVSTAVGVALAAIAALAVSIPLYFAQEKRSRILAENRLLSRLQSEAEKLWPAHPEKVAGMEAWLKEAAALAGRLETYRLALEDLRAEALPGNRESPEHRTWTFDDESMQSRHDTLAELVDGLEAFTDAETGTLKSIEGLLAFTRTVCAESAGKHKKDWDRAIASIASRAECPRYDGLVLKPIFGLVPVGRDPESGLWEFAHPRTGSAPERGPNGRLLLREGSGLVFVLVPGGRFDMGAVKPGPDHPPGGSNVDPYAKPNEGPVHPVTLEPFFLSKYEMTQGQWLRFTALNPSLYGPDCWFGGKQHSLLHPVENVSREEAGRVLFRLGLRLPYEAEWEYAARAGTTTVWWTGDAKESLVGAANLKDLSYTKHMGISEGSFEKWLDDGYVTHAPVDSYRPNPFGFHNMYGNVYEWCEDTWHPDYSDAPSNGSAWIDRANSLHVCRDCCWDGDAESCRPVHRIWRGNDYRDCGLGVRPVANLKSFGR